MSRLPVQGSGLKPSRFYPQTSHIQTGLATGGCTGEEVGSRGLQGEQERSLEKPDGTEHQTQRRAQRSVQRPATPPYRFAAADRAPGLLSSWRPRSPVLPGDYDEPPGLRATGAMHPIPQRPTHREWERRENWSPGVSTASPALPHRGCVFPLLT